VHKVEVQVVGSQYVNGRYYTQYNEEVTLVYEISADGGNTYASETAQQTST
jgi:hypothetical protein